MSTGLKLKRGNSDIPLSDGEIYLNKNRNVVQVGNDNEVLTLVSINSTIQGDINIEGNITARNISGNLNGKAVYAQSASYANVAEYALTTMGVMEKAETANYAEIAKTAPDYTRLEDFNKFTSTHNTGSFLGELNGIATTSSYSQYSELANLANDVNTKKYLTTGSAEETQTIQGTLKINGRLITDCQISASQTIIKDNVISVTAYDGELSKAGLKVLLDDTEKTSIIYDTKTDKWNIDKTLVGEFEGTINNAVSSSYPIELREDTLYCGLASNVFFGKNVAETVEGINNSVFLGSNSGRFSKQADNCVFIGYEAGDSTIDSDNSVLIGYRAGKNYDGSGIGNNNIIIGTNITLSDGVSNAINLGGVIFATDTNSNRIEDPISTASQNGKVGICNPNPTHTLDVNGSVNITELLKLTPVTALPTNVQAGTIVSMGLNNTFKLCIYTGDNWKTISLI
jgi:hypothetical protein